MTIKHINILFKGIVNKITTMGRWGTLVCHAKDHEWDIGDILDVPVSPFYKKIQAMEKRKYVKQFGRTNGGVKE